MEGSCANPPPIGMFFVPLHVYIDESGIHGGSKKCAVAGFAGGAKKVKLFEDSWKRLMCASRIPEDKGFHAKSFFKRSSCGKRYGIYADWSDSKVVDFIESINTLVTTHHLTPIGGSVTCDKFMRESHNLRRYLTGGNYDVTHGKWVSSGAPNKPYFFVFHQVVLAGCKLSAGVIADFFFDRQDDFSGHALKLWNQLKHLSNKEYEVMGGIAFYSRFERVCLQVADLIAYCAYHADSVTQADSNPDLLYAIDALFGRVRNPILVNMDGVIDHVRSHPPRWLDAQDLRDKISSK
jgi:hypothetical protein